MGNAWPLVTCSGSLSPPLVKTPGQEGDVILTHSFRKRPPLTTPGAEEPRMTHITVAPQHLLNLTQVENVPVGTGPSLADIFAFVEADHSTNPRQRSDRLSALRSLARVLDQDLRTISASPRTLSLRFKDVIPAAVGISPGRWANIRSRTLAALEQAGERVIRGRSSAPLTPAWQQLELALPTLSAKRSLSRFMRFCSAQGIEPAQVSEAVFERFGTALVEDSFVKSPHTVHRGAAAAWNNAAKTMPDWPQISAAIPMNPRNYSLEWSAFPPSFKHDAEDFLGRISDGDPFADDHAPALKPGTVEMRRKQLRQIATALVCKGIPINSITALAVLAETEHARLILKFFYDRLGKTGYLHQQALLLKTIAKSWSKAPVADVQTITDFAKRSAVRRDGMTDKNRERLRQFDDPVNVQRLLRLGAKIFEALLANDDGGVDGARRAMFALSIELLIVAPMRIDNLVGLDLARHIVKTRSGPSATQHIVIPKNETKTGEPFEITIPARTAALLIEYRTKYLPRLSSQPSTLLFPNPNGRRRNTTRFSVQISAFVKAETGLLMNVHLFRHLAVKLYTEACGGDLETMRRLLGHRNLTTTERSYSEMRSKPAFDRFEKVIEALRTEGGYDRGPTTAHLPRRRKGGW